PDDGSACVRMQNWRPCRESSDCFAEPLLLLSHRVVVELSRMEVREGSGRRMLLEQRGQGTRLAPRHSRARHPGIDREVPFTSSAILAPPGNLLRGAQRRCECELASGRI